jgi:hypothetical protein
MGYRKTKTNTIHPITFLSDSLVPKVMWNLLGLFNPLLKALKETAYQFQRPYILDDSAARKTFGMQPTEWKQILKEVVAETRASDL